MSEEIPATSTAPPTLEYGRRSRFGFIGRNRKKLIFLALCIAIGVPIYRNWEPLKRRALWIYWAHRAAAFQMPAQPFERVIIDPDRAKAAVAANSDYLMSGNVAIYAPLAYRRLVELDPRIPKTPGSILLADVVFMGTMIQPDGTPRLVIVTEDVDWKVRPYYIFVFPIPRWVDPLPPANKSTPPWAMRGFISSYYVERKPSPAYTGVLNPKDRSHLIIANEFPLYAAWQTMGADPATLPKLTRDEKSNLHLLYDGRFLERIDDGSPSMIEPIERPPRPTVRGK